MQMVMKIMPLFLGFISWTFPTGLVLYFAASALFRIGQQSVIIRMDDSHDDEEAPDDGDSDEKDAAGPSEDRKGPSPHASKKRKKRRRK
jgi:membrane protein insertase Oxa1/YidC/SpoIIIJ